MKKLIAVAMLAGGMFAAVPSHADVVDVAGELYIDSSDASVWDESNGLAGLQREASGGIAADTRLA